MTEVELRDGTRIEIRPLRPGDEPMVESGFAELSETSRFRRFMTGTSHLSPATLRRLIDVDGVDHAVFGAGLLDGAGPSRVGIAIARYVRSRSDPTSAELAVTVVDAYQRRGVATALVEELAEHARRNGIERFTGQVLAENRPAIALLRSRGGEVLATDDPTVVVGVIELDRGPSD